MKISRIIIIVHVCSSCQQISQILEINFETLLSVWRIVMRVIFFILSIHYQGRNFFSSIVLLNVSSKADLRSQKCFIYGLLTDF